MAVDCRVRIMSCLSPGTDMFPPLIYHSTKALWDPESVFLPFVPDRRLPPDLVYSRSVALVNPIFTVATTGEKM